VLAGLTTGHKIGLGLAAVIFIGFALASAMAIPRGRPDFPGKLLPAFVIACVTLFVGMMAAVEVFGAEEKEKEAGKPETTAPAPAPSPAPAGDAAHGKMLYASLGCQACHTLNGSTSAGPTFKGVAGSKVQLTDGSTVTADDAYLAESIRDPDKQTVKGFQKGVMSSTIKPGQVSDADVADLVAFIRSLK
jgi:cytochrome c oxidase subunit II